jgi:hypothetical protein
LAACGGNDQPVTTTSAKPVVTATPIVAASEASSPVATSAPSPASDSAPVKPILIDVYGDDSMMGLTGMNYSMPTITQNSEPNVSQMILRAQFPGVTIANHASGGTASTLVNMMAGVDGGGPPFAQRIVGSKSVIVLDNHAINDDLVQSLGPYADALIQWVQDVRNAGKVPVIEEPNPVCDDNHPYLQNYVTTMDNIAIAYNVPLVRQYNEILALPNWQAHMSGCLYPDDYLLSIKAQRQAAILAPLVKAAVKK